MSEPPATPSYAELAALVAEQAAQLAEQAVLIKALRVELEALRRQAGRDSSNSSQPPSTDGPAAKAKAKAARRPAQPAPEGQPAAGEPDRLRRKQGGQPGHRGSSLAPVAILWVPRTRSPHATCTYSWMMPPSRSRRSGRTVAPERGGVLPAGGR